MTVLSSAMATQGLPAAEEPAADGKLNVRVRYQVFLDEVLVSVTSPGDSERGNLVRASGRTLRAAVVVGPGKVRAARCQPAWWRSGCRGRCPDKCRRSG